MLAIKKVQVVPLDENYGKIIDSFNTQDDKTKNAPSINAVEDYIETKTVAQDNIAYINTSFDIEPSDTYHTENINLPTGFTKDNCVILSTMIKSGNSTVWQTPDGYGYDTQVGTPKFYVTLGGLAGSDHIKVEYDIGTHSSTLTVNMKIVLMKIS